MTSALRAGSGQTPGPAGHTARKGPAPAERPDLEAWIGSFGAELSSHLERLLGGADEAEDVLQRVWITAHRKPPEACEPGRVRAWLYRVATNAALDRLAARRRRREALEGRPLAAVADPPPAPDRSVRELGARGRARVRRHLAELPPKQRQAVWMRWVEELPYRDIAARLDCSEESARANVYQGLKRLRRELFDLWNEEVTS